jgi:hypothetical protein
MYGAPQHPVALMPPALLPVHPRTPGNLEPYMDTVDVLAGDLERLHREFAEIKHLLLHVAPGAPNTPSTVRSRDASRTSLSTTPSLSPLTTSGPVPDAKVLSSGQVAPPGVVGQAQSPAIWRPTPGAAIASLPGGVRRGHDGPGKTAWHENADSLGTNKGQWGTTAAVEPSGHLVGTALDNFPPLGGPSAGHRSSGVHRRATIQDPGPPPPMPPPWTLERPDSHDGASTAYQGAVSQQPRRPRVSGPRGKERQDGIPPAQNGHHPGAPPVPPPWVRPVTAQTAREEARPSGGVPSQPPALARPSTGQTAREEAKPSAGVPPPSAPLARPSAAQTAREQARPSSGRPTVVQRPAGAQELGTDRAAGSHRPSVKGPTLPGTTGRGLDGGPEARNRRGGEVWSRMAPANGSLSVPHSPVHDPREVELATAASQPLVCHCVDPHIPQRPVGV